MTDAPPQPTPARDGQLAENIVYFARALRAAGIPVGPGAVLDALAAVQAAGVGTREDFYWTLHAVFVKRHEHSLAVRPGVPICSSAASARSRQAARRDVCRRRRPRAGREAASPARQRVQEALFAGQRRESSEKPPEVEIDARLTVSDREVLQKKDFAQMTAAEIAAAKDAIKRLVLSLDEVKTRRLAPNRARPPHRSAPHAAREPEGRRRGHRPEISRPATQGSRRSSRCSIFPAR